MQRALGSLQCQGEGSVCDANAAMCVAPQDRAQGDHQQFVDVVQAGIAGPRVLQPLKAGDKVVQHGLPRQSWLAGGRTDSV